MASTHLVVRAEPQIRLSKSRPTLSQWVRLGNVAAVSKALHTPNTRRPPDANRRDARGESLLSIALGMSRNPSDPYTLRLDQTHEDGLATVSASQLQLIQVLLDAGARTDLPARRNTAWTPLHQVAALGQPLLIRRLLNHTSFEGREVRDEAGRTPLHVALTHEGQGLDRTDVHAWLSAGSNPNALDDQGLSPLAVAIGTGRPLSLWTALVAAGAQWQSNTPAGQSVQQALAQATAKFKPADREAWHVRALAALEAGAPKAKPVDPLATLDRRQTQALRSLGPTPDPKKRKAPRP